MYGIFKNKFRFLKDPQEKLTPEIRKKYKNTKIDYICKNDGDTVKVYVEIRNYKKLISRLQKPWSTSF